MNRFKCFPLFLIVALAVLLFGSVQPAFAAIINGSFELGTGADADNWNEIETAGGTAGASATADRSTVMPNTGLHSIFLNVVGAADFGPVAEIQQQTPAGSVVPGLSYDFSFFTKGNAGPGTVAFYEVIWFDGDGSDGGGPQGSATGLQNFSSSLGAAYAPEGMASLVAPLTADSALVQIRLVTGAFNGANGSAYVDDVSFAAIPEPSSLLLTVVGALAMIVRRSR